MSPLMILDPLEKSLWTLLLVSMVVPFSQTVERCFYIRQPAEYVINTSLFAIALARHNTC